MVDKNIATPLYIQLQNKLIQDIEDKMKPHQKMISEREISKEFDVSRTTVRLALYELENAGYIYKRHGKGTFVASLNRNKQNLSDHYSFTDQMRSIGKVPKTEVLFFDIVPSNQYVSEKLAVKQDEHVYRLKRLRLADGVPMMLEVSYLPVLSFPHLTEEMIQNKPLYEIFREDYGQKIKIVDEEFSVGLVSFKESKILEITEGSPALQLKRQTYNQEDTVIEFTLTIAKGDEFVYKMRHKKV